MSDGVTSLELAEDSVISDLHLDEIAQTRCTYWKSLPSRLGLEDIVAEDIDRNFSREFDKRRELFRQWKQIKGSEATYRCLVKALLDINQRHDAEYVSGLLRQKAADYSNASSGIALLHSLASACGNSTACLATTCKQEACSPPPSPITCNVM